MSRMRERIRELVARREVQISDHGYDELADDDLFVDDIMAGLADGVVGKEYPAYHKGLCVLVLQWDGHDEPVACGMGNSQERVFTSRPGDGVPARPGTLERGHTRGGQVLTSRFLVE